LLLKHDQHQFNGRQGVGGKAWAHQSVQEQEAHPQVAGMVVEGLCGEAEALESVKLLVLIWVD
jgi:hypothetical protein